MGDGSAWLLFLGGYAMYPARIGSVAPDSRHCVDALLRNAALDSARVVLELGSASGTVTREILRRKSADARLVCVEMHPPFAERLRSEIVRDDCRILMRDVFDAEPDLRRSGIRDHEVDCIISTLPCSNIPFDRLLGRRIVPSLSSRGVFVQYIHVLSFLRGVFPRTILERHFGEVREEFVLLNFPPAVVYTCRLPRHRRFEPVHGTYDFELEFGEVA